jgi:hypothetical protein
MNDLKFVPVESTLIFYCDYAKISQSSLADEFMPFLREHINHDFNDREFERFRTITGFDPEKDFDSILLAVNAENEFDSRRRSKANPYIIIHGNFDEKRIINYMEKKADEKDEDIAWHVKKLDKFNLYIFNDSDDNFGFAFPNKHTLYVGASDWLQNVLKEKAYSSDRKIRDLVKTVRHRDQFWLTVNTLSNSLPKSFHSIPMSDRIVSLSFSASAGSELKLYGQIICDSPETSNLMVDMMKGGLAMAKLQVYKDREAVDALDQIDIDSQGNRVLLKGNLDKEFFRRLDKHKMLPWSKRRG